MALRAPRAFFESIGLRPGGAMALGAGAAELVGGLLLALGSSRPRPRPAVRRDVLRDLDGPRHPWSVGHERRLQVHLVLLAVAFAVTAVGPGAWSLDDVLGLDAYGAGWAVASLATA
jgi:putative oxidoreductase